MDTAKFRIVAECSEDELPKHSDVLAEIVKSSQTGALIFANRLDQHKHIRLQIAVKETLVALLAEPVSRDSIDKKKAELEQCIRSWWSDKGVRREIEVEYMGVPIKMKVLVSIVLETG